MPAGADSAGTGVSGCYQNGRGVAQDIPKAMSLYEDAIAKGSIKPYYNMGNMYYAGKVVERDYKKAAQWFRKGADAGHRPAQYYMGLCYYNGRGVSKDLEQALHYFELAAEQGLVEAQYELADCYFNLWVFIEDMKDEFHPYLRQKDKWLNKAAEGGSIKAMEWLGKFYPEETLYTDAGIQRRMEWNEKASNKGSAEAAFNQGQIYEYCFKDRKTAKQWYQKASRRGHEKARDKLNQVYFKNL